jgi:hypothetical protein
MVIADLFVNLGIKGNNQAGKALGGVQSGLDKISTSGLAAKAAMVGLLYGLQRLSSASAEEGTRLSNFATLTGISTKALQQWAYVAKTKVGASAQDVESSFKSLQAKMTDIITTGNAPVGWSWIKAAGIGAENVDLRDTLGVMEKINEFVQMNKDKPDILRKIFGDFGISENMAAGMLKGIFTDKNLSKAPTYSEAQIKQLDHVRGLWSQIGDKIERSMGMLNAKHGGKLVGDIDKLIPKVLKLVDSFERLATNAKFFEHLGRVFDGWGMIFEGLSDVLDRLSGKTKAKDTDVTPKEVFNTIKEDLKSFGERAKEHFKSLGSKAIDSIPLRVAPTAGGFQITPNVNTNVNQTFNFSHPGDNASQIGVEAGQAARQAVSGQAVKQAASVMPSRGRVN